MSSTFKDHIELFHEGKVFIDTKTIVAVGDIDEDTFELFAKNLHALDSKNGEITIMIMSDGGNVSVARGIYDLIRECKNRVKVKCYGEVSSAATIILQAADVRIMTPSSKLMIHYGYESVPSSIPENRKRTVEEFEKDKVWMEDIYLKQIKKKKKKFTKAQLVAKLKYDTYLNAKESLEIGLIDEISVTHE